MSEPVRTPATSQDLTDLMLSYLKAREARPGPFTAHDVTEAFRVARPELDIQHSAVRAIVRVAMENELAQGNYTMRKRADIQGQPYEYVPIVRRGR